MFTFSKLVNEGGGGANFLKIPPTHFMDTPLVYGMGREMYKIGLIVLKRSFNITRFPEHLQSDLVNRVIHQIRLWEKCKWNRGWHHQRHDDEERYIPKCHLFQRLGNECLAEFSSRQSISPSKFKVFKKINGLQFFHLFSMFCVIC